MTAAAALQEQSPSKFVIIDGYGFVFRAFFALPPLTDPQGRPAGAVFGFVKMISKLLADPAVTHVCAALDHGSQSFRNTIYSDYKAHRPEAPEDLRAQFPLIRDACTAMGIPAVEKEGFEADDIIACLARTAEQRGMKAVIVSSDKDLMQLVNAGIVMYDPVKSKTLDITAVEEKTGVRPELIADFLALTGDSADNVPGVPGIGPKTASALLNEFGSLQAVLDAAPQMRQKKRRESLIEHRENALLSRRLVALDEQACADISPEELRRTDNHRDTLRAFCTEMGFKSVVRDMDSGALFAAKPNGAGGEAPQPAGKGQIFSEENFTLHDSADAFAAAAADLPHGEQVTGIDIDEHNGARFYAFSYHDTAHGYITDADGEPAALRALATLAADARRETACGDMKYLLRLCAQAGIACTPCAAEDVGLLSYTAGVPGGHEPEDIIARDYDGTPLPKPDRKSADDTRALYAGFRAHVYASVSREMRTRAEQKRVSRIYRRIEQPLQTVLARAEARGVYVHIPTLNELSERFRAKADDLAVKIHEEAGEGFNIGSPKQLGEILFDKMGLAPGKKTGKSKQFSTNAETLEELAAQGADIAANVLEWRHFTKLVSTYTDALPKLADEQSRIHTRFSMIAANTGRLSSVNPNLQNIPVRSEEGGAIRAAFKAPEGHKLISADYSQIELRLLAHIADMASLKEAFANGEDIHAATAAEIFALPKDGVTAEHRRKAKTVNFGIIYGISAYGLATRLRVPQKEAKEIIERYFARYPGIRRYMEKAKAEAREHKYIRTLYGRVCPIPEIASGNYAMRAFAERAAINAPLQGAAADIIKTAMIRADAALRDAFPEAGLVLQVHDELLVEAPESQAEDAAALLREVMENTADLSVKLAVDAGIGDSWAEAH